MWVLRRTEPELWTVGYYSPGGEWHPEGGDFGTLGEAEAQVHYLNGGDIENVLGT